MSQICPKGAFARARIGVVWAEGAAPPVERVLVQAAGPFNVT